MGLLSAGALASSGMGRLSAIENAGVSLEVMMGDAQRAQGFLDDVLAFARTTPFAFPDLAETSRNLVAFGMDEANVIPTMQQSVMQLPQVVKVRKG
ncbi:phage tail length tape-measure protein [Geomicrobium sp. JCM 19037]|nr:phage tail length tape-measure protein [Geomicrobium sp. JCM 19037]